MSDESETVGDRALGLLFVVLMLCLTAIVITGTIVLIRRMCVDG